MAIRSIYTKKYGRSCNVPDPAVGYAAKTIIIASGLEYLRIVNPASLSVNATSTIALLWSKATTATVTSAPENPTTTSVYQSVTGPSLTAAYIHLE